MIATTPSASQINLDTRPADRQARWQQLAAEAITDPAVLIEMLALDPSLVPAARRAAESFGLRVPRGFVARMRKGDPRDPLLLQVLPLDDELRASAGFQTDPVGDMTSRVAPGVLHKYAGRALFISTGACAVHCRYCFRRHFPYANETASADRWQSALAYVARDPTINEIILSGGDPLNLSDLRLAELTNSLKEVRHVKRLRIHTRTAVVLPERIDAGFCGWLRNVGLQKLVVLHVNHPQEIGVELREACLRLRDCGATLLNQSVLLRDVNDSAEVLAELSESLFAAGVMPYYLSLLDRVQGAAHFEVEEARALELIGRVTARLPGYLVPKLVREIEGRQSKTSVSLFV